MKISVIIPTKNAERFLNNLFLRLKEQLLRPHQLIIVDSSSTDATLKIATQFNAQIIQIKEEEFNHGKARNLGASVATGDVFVFMTQDVIPADKNLLKNLTSPLSQNFIGASYARQIPKADANPIEIYFRTFNYPNKKIIKEINQTSELGIKTFFFSNVCSAIRKDIFEEIGGFPEDVIINEDMFFASEVLKKGYKIVYEPSAVVYHSHNYSFFSLFKRYFDIGVFMKNYHIGQNDMLAEKEGIKYLIGLTRFLIKNNVKWLPYAVVDTMTRFLGYKLGLMEKHIPIKIKSKISLNKNFWKQYAKANP